MEILNSSQMAEADAYTIREIGVPSIVLMENAAITVVDEILERIPDVINVAVVAGAGNNGGDGFAIARQLLNLGVVCDIFLACEEDKLKGDGLINYNILKNYGATIIPPLGEDDKPFFEEYDLTVDALFGTGLSRPLEGFLRISGTADQPDIILCAVGGYPKRTVRRHPQYNRRMRGCRPYGYIRKT